MDEQPALERRMQLDLRAFVNSLLRAQWSIVRQDGLMMAPPWDRESPRELILYPRTMETYNGQTHIVAVP